MTRAEDEHYKFLSLTGVAMRLDHARDYLEPELNKLKAEVLDHDPDTPVCLHRSDIHQKKGPFGCLGNPEKREAFDQRILSILTDCEYAVITAVIDKAWMSRQEHWVKPIPTIISCK